MLRLNVCAEFSNKFLMSTLTSFWASSFNAATVEFLSAVDSVLPWSWLVNVEIEEAAKGVDALGKELVTVWFSAHTKIKLNFRSLFYKKLSKKNENLQIDDIKNKDK